MKVRSLKGRSYRKTGGPPYWGNRHSEFEPGCFTCEAYKFFDEHGRFPSRDEVSDLTVEVLSKEHEKHVTWLETDEGKKWLAKADRDQERRKRTWARWERSRWLKKNKGLKALKQQ